jgi:hypothetical protein
MNEQSAYPPDGVWNFNNWPLNEVAILKQLCQRIEKLFELPARRLYRHFASEADDWHSHFAGECEYGRYYRGVHVPSSELGNLPPELRKHLSAPQRRNKTGNEPPEFDNVVYIRDSTGADQTGCAITYAHELQHVVQHSRFPSFMELTKVLRKNLHAWATEIDIPAERDANIASKRVAEVVCGVKAVRTFAEKQIRLMEEEGATNQVKRWMFFRDISSCDLKAETLAMARKHKQNLTERDIDLDQPALRDD